MALFNTSAQIISLAGPPVLGAFIGYLTNKVAIRMLFRPLRARYLFGVRLPMTPGVIPSKRHELAVNIGNMVGDHLLTSRDIGEALSRERFQDHLRKVIDERISALLARNLGSLSDIIPAHFSPYLKAGVDTLKNRLHKTVEEHVNQEYFQEQVSSYLFDNFSHIAERKINDLAGSHERQALYLALEEILFTFLAKEQTEQWLAAYLQQETEKPSLQAKTMGELLPQSLVELIKDALCKYAPILLGQLAKLLSEEPVRERIIKAVRGGVDEFITSLGPLGTMAGNFLDMEMLEGKIRQYLVEKDDEIAAWLQNEEVQHRFLQVLIAQVDKFCNTEFKQLLGHISQEQQDAACREIARQILQIFRSQGVRETLSDMLRENMEKWLAEGERNLGEVAEDLLPETSRDALKENVAREIVALLRTRKSARLLASLTDAMIDSVLARPIGILAQLMPQGVRRGLTDGVTLTANRMLLQEVPGLVDSLNIRRIVTEKVDSLDLLQVEELLLSIMKEQFKYINLFGALLGFLIGLANLLILSLAA